jgi:histone H1/5
MNIQYILMLKDRTGSSQQAIAKFVEKKHKKVLPSKFKKVLSVQLKKFVKSERLVKVKNSFKVSSIENLKYLGAKVMTQKTKKKAVPKKIAEKRAKTKRLSQVETPEKNPLTPMKRKGSKPANRFIEALQEGKASK